MSTSDGGRGGCSSPLSQHACARFDDDPASAALSSYRNDPATSTSISLSVALTSTWNDGVDYSCARPLAPTLGAPCSCSSNGGSFSTHSLDLPYPSRTGDKHGSCSCSCGHDEGRETFHAFSAMVVDLGRRKAARRGRTELGCGRRKLGVVWNVEKSRR